MLLQNCSVLSLEAISVSRRGVIMCQAGKVAAQEWYFSVIISFRLNLRKLFMTARETQGFLFGPFISFLS